MESIGIELKHGLCNRLRCLFGWYHYARSHLASLVVYWIPDSECPGFFLDYFEPLPETSIRSEKKDNPLPFLVYTGGQWHPDFNPKTIFIYRDLRLLPHTREAIDQVWKRIGGSKENVIAIHVRRTDHKSLAQRHHVYSEDEDFFAFVDRYPDKKVYLATDNPQTQQRFLHQYGSERILWNIEIVSQPVLRKTSVQDAIIDLYIAVEAHDFMGSGYSSFTDTIHQLRRASATL